MDMQDVIPKVEAVNDQCDARLNDVIVDEEILLVFSHRIRECHECEHISICQANDYLYPVDECRCH
jgi:hypothetical protein